MHAAVTDEETGFLNYRGMVMAGLRYADTFRLYGDDYTATSSMYRNLMPSD